MLKSKTYIAVPPGETIKEQLEIRGMSQKEFALHMDLSEKHISKLINGEVQLTPDVAYRLEMVFGIPAKFWNGLEANYRNTIIKANDEIQRDIEKEIERKCPYNEMVKNKWVPNTPNESDRIINLRKFFEVSSLTNLENSQLKSMAFRQLSKEEMNNYSLLACLQKAKLEARQINTASINLKLLEKYLETIKVMTLEKPSSFYPKLSSLLAECGIAFVVLPSMDGSFLHGVTFKDNKKIVLALTLHEKEADKFWFSLFHEFGHLLLGHLEQPKQKDTSSLEKEADLFAKNTLIPQSLFDDFVSQGSFSKASVLNFASSNKILPGIIVVRLQKEGIITYTSLNNLKTKYALSI